MLACHGSGSDTADHESPAPLFPQADLPGEWAQVSLGGVSACALDTGGQALCWGSVDSPGSERLSAVGVMNESACGVLESGGVTCWGREIAEVPEGDWRALAISVDDFSACALTDLGTVVCWGEGEFEGMPADVSFVSADSSDTHVCALAATNARSCWGSDAHGGSASDPGYGPSGEMSEISVGHWWNCGKLVDSEIACWNDEEEVRIGSIESAHVRMDDDGAWAGVCWLEGTQIACHDLDDDSSYGAIAEQVPALSFQSVDVGANVVCGVKSDGTITCVGDAGRISEMP